MVQYSRAKVKMSKSRGMSGQSVPTIVAGVKVKKREAVDEGKLVFTRGGDFFDVGIFCGH